MREHEKILKEANDSTMGGKAGAFGGEDVED